MPIKDLSKDKGRLTINNEEFSEKLNNKIGYLPEERGLYKGFLFMKSLNIQQS